jgi:hypothetical protein
MREISKENQFMGSAFNNNRNFRKNEREKLISEINQETLSELRNM